MADYLTYADIYGQVQDLIDDDDSDTLTIIQFVINNVYREVVAEFRKGRSLPPWLVDYDDTLDTTADQRYTTLNTENKNVERILAVSVDNQPCLPITPMELELGSNQKSNNNSPETWWSTSNTTRPTRFYHEKTYAAAGTETNKLLWFPMPDAAYDIRYWFEKRVSILSGTNAPILPPMFHHILVYGSLVQAEMYDIRVKAGPWDVLYDQTLQQLKGFSNNFVLSGYTESWGQ